MSEPREPVTAAGELRDWSDDRSLLDGSPLDRARWLLCSEGWLEDAAKLDAYVAAARADALAEIRAGVEGLAGVGVPTAGRPAFVSRAAVLALLDPPK